MKIQNRKFVTAVIAGPAIALLAAAMVASGVAHANGDSGSLPRFYGVLNSRPNGTNIGNWVLGNRTFVADANTQFEFLAGPLDVGVCARAKYESINGVDHAVEIESQNPSDCGSGSATPGSTPSASPSVSPSPSSSPSPSPTSTPIPGFTNRAYGILSALPAGRIGNWVAGGVTYQVTASTELHEESGTFVIGACVKTRYVVSSSVNVALEIETESASDCNGLSGGGGNGGSSSNDAKVYAPIDSFPASPFTGAWTLAGVTYQADANTRFEQEKGAFANGACVEARYSAAGGVNTLTRVKTTESYKCQGLVGSNPNPVLHSYGTIELFPVGLLGVWHVSNISYTTTASTTYEQSHGTFAVGAFVEVKYQMVNGARVVVKIETHVAPEAGLGRGSGRLDNRPSDDWGQWTIAGVTYQGDRAIEVEIRSSGTLSAASTAATSARTVAVNYYELDGVRYATSVRELVRQTYLPLTLK